MERVRLDEHATKIQLAEQLPQHRPLVVFAGGAPGFRKDVTPLVSTPGGLST